MAAQSTGSLAVTDCRQRLHPSMIQSIANRLLCMVELCVAVLLGLHKA